MNYILEQIMATPEDLKFTINLQTQLIRDEIDTKKNIQSLSDVNKRKTEYQIKTTQGIETMNNYLFYTYYVLFAIALLNIFIKQYYYGVKRNNIIDAILFVFFLTYPLVIFHVEMFIYNGDFMRLVYK